MQFTWEQTSMFSQQHKGMIGYMAVELAYKAIHNESIDPIVDTDCKFYNAENMNDPDIAKLIYD